MLRSAMFIATIRKIRHWVAAFSLFLNHLHRKRPSSYFRLGKTRVATPWLQWFPPQLSGKGPGNPLRTRVGETKQSWNQISDAPLTPSVVVLIQNFFWGGGPLYCQDNPSCQVRGFVCRRSKSELPEYGHTCFLTHQDKAIIWLFCHHETHELIFDEILFFFSKTWFFSALVGGFSGNALPENWVKLGEFVSVIPSPTGTQLDDKLIAPWSSGCSRQIFEIDLYAFRSHCVPVPMHSGQYVSGSLNTTFRQKVAFDLLTFELQTSWHGFQTLDFQKKKKKTKKKQQLYFVALIALSFLHFLELCFHQSSLRTPSQDGFKNFMLEALFYNWN